jgi:hypothetical protein
MMKAGLNLSNAFSPEEELARCSPRERREENGMALDRERPSVCHFDLNGRTLVEEEGR